MRITKPVSSIVKVRKAGSSLAITLSPHACHQLGVEAGDFVGLRMTYDHHVPSDVIELVTQYPLKHRMRPEAVIGLIFKIPGQVLNRRVDPVKIKQRKIKKEQ